MAKETHVKLVFLGFLLIFLGIIFMLFSIFLSEGTVSFGGIILIGPIPIVVGAGPHAFLAVIVAFVLTIISILLFMWLRRWETSETGN